MAIFYTDTGSFAEVMISGSGEGILSVSGSSGPLLSVSDLTAANNVFQITSASVHLFKIDQQKNVQISGSLIVTGSISLNGSAIGAGGGGDLIIQAGGSTNTVSQLVFSNTNNVSFGLNGSTLTAIAGPQEILSYYNPSDGYVQVASSFGNNTLLMQPAQFPDVQFDRVAIPVNYSNASNSTGTVSITMQWALYTRVGSTLSSISSVSSGATISFGGTVSSYSQYAGMRLFTMGLTGTITEGQYYVGFFSRSTTGGQNASFSNMAASQINTNFSGIFGAASVSSAQYTRGLGIYSATTSQMPASIAFSQIQGTASQFLRRPLFYMVSQTF